jgi:heme/copper-type cytochrome/quinol oxidase subunit 3
MSILAIFWLVLVAVAVLFAAFMLMYADLRNWWVPHRAVKHLDEEYRELVKRFKRHG